MGDVDLSTTYGAMFIGGSSVCSFFGLQAHGYAVLFATFFQGVLTLQAFLYYENFPKDPIVLKLLVAAVWVLDLVHLILVSQSCYHYLIGSWGDSAALLVSTKELDLHLVFVGFACFICQCFFISRIWSFSHKNWILSVALGIPCLVVLVLETNISAEISRIANVAAFNQFTGEVLSVFALAAAVDVAIALILVWYLQQGKTSFDRSSFVVGRIVQYTVATGLATSILAVADLIVYLVTPHTFIFIAMHFSMGRMYTNALLAT
ncbi:ANK-REP-REGION domain-containing protein [Mycena chlorophos]|uniref:ANK-REP-REGION domain-containing protein n=1 Tax=Mycena chlorophos TaxID=658473 RepID=A0A8H6TM25_MYCCL|nr:ANK-REP-REGION domain-containing protein [Mycena chlorophos]